MKLAGGAAILALVGSLLIAQPVAAAR